VVLPTTMMMHVKSTVLTTQREKWLRTSLRWLFNVEWHQSSQIALDMHVVDCCVSRFSHRAIINEPSIMSIKRTLLVLARSRAKTSSRKFRECIPFYPSIPFYTCMNRWKSKYLNNLVSHRAGRSFPSV
jgi:hypothetical protein